MKILLHAGTLFGTLLGVLLGAQFSGAQQATAPSKPSPASQTPAAKSPAGATATEPRGKRRDPFHTLIPEKKPEESAPVRLPPGKRGLVIEQLELQGIARAVDGSWIAVVDNKSKRAYFLHEKDQLYNGVVSKITPDRVIFLENPPGSSAGQTGSREVVKRLGPE